MGGASPNTYCSDSIKSFALFFFKCEKLINPLLSGCIHISTVLVGRLTLNSVFGVSRIFAFYIMSDKMSM